MQLYWILLGVLGVWRITHFLSAEDGPWQIGAWLRRRAGSGFWGDLLDCFYCLSLWVAAPFALLLAEGPKAQFCCWLAFSAGAILLQRVIPEPPPPMPTYFEHGDQNDALLRKSENRSAANHDHPED
jgi:hypothetical protein